MLYAGYTLGIFGVQKIMERDHNENNPFFEQHRGIIGTQSNI